MHGSYFSNSIQTPWYARIVLLKRDTNRMGLVLFQLNVIWLIYIQIGKILIPWKNYLVFFFLMFFFFEREGERQRDKLWVGEGERERESQNLKQVPGSVVVSTEPDVRLKLTDRWNPWPQPKSDALTNWATQVPRLKEFFKNKMLKATILGWY